MMTMMTKHGTTVAQRQHEGVAAWATTADGMLTISLQTMKEIEKTVDTLCGFSKSFLGLASQADMLKADIDRSTIAAGKYIDGPGTQCVVLADLSERFDRISSNFAKQKNKVDQDRRLDSHYKSQLHDSFDEAIRKAKMVVESIRGLQAAMTDHDNAARATLLAQNTSEASRVNFVKIQRSNAFTVVALREAAAAHRKR